MSPTPDFHATLAGASRGDGDAWRDLYRAHSRAVLGYLRAQRAPSPEDLLGEVWLQAVRDLGRFSGDEAGFRAWLLSIAHHRLLDARRALQRRPDEVGGDQLVEEIASEGEDAFGRLAAEQDLLHLLDGLPERHRAVLYLRFVLDMPQRDVARVLGVSTPAMKMLQTRATGSLRRRVAQLQAEGAEIEALPSEPVGRLGN